MKNPYDVLGIPQGAPIEQVKAAYKELARKYQDDRYSNGPLSSVAEKKMQELDEAYDRIIMDGTSRSSAQTSGGGYYQANTSYASTDFSDIRSKIKSGRIDDAQLLLDGIPVSERNAEWYYLKGSVLQKRGWLEEAAKDFETACNMDPSNSTYSAAFNSVKKARNGGYKTNSSSRKGCSSCDLCSGLLCADCCCECFGGDIIPCC